MAYSIWEVLSHFRGHKLFHCRLAESSDLLSIKSTEKAICLERNSYKYWSWLKQMKTSISISMVCQLRSFPNKIYPYTKAVITTVIRTIQILLFNSSDKSQLHPGQFIKEVYKFFIAHISQNWKSRNGRRFWKITCWNLFIDQSSRGQKSCM